MHDANGDGGTHRISRRRLLALGGACAAGWTLGGVAYWRQRNEGGQRADVFIGRAPDYGVDLAGTIRAGLTELGVGREEIRGKRVLLKPNLVETAAGHQHINTHPALVVAAAEVFRALDAAAVFVGEAPGHRRDTALLLEESGLDAALRAAGLPFHDLNYDDVVAQPNAGQCTRLEKLYLPKTLVSADVIVSLPKLKTHHWVGMTCAMKNFFGVLPGVMYGWPKNVLHFAGISESILDINVTVRPALAIVDAIVGMEGDGPIMGNPKPVGAIVIGRNLPAVDATCARIMGLAPSSIPYLRRAAGRLGPIQERNIHQRGERPAEFATHFANAAKMSTSIGR
jgi:uncharacterized protein (DUF362 family)